MITPNIASYLCMYDYYELNFSVNSYAIKAIVNYYSEWHILRLVPPSPAPSITLKEEGSH